ncbi:MAG: hypothetical protein BRC25_03420 [Parcubacteria group bacterium SW_6_46_9]|nr:MAG: hypothetical protein BRC25_03420 [Parcubacteria group bacterium SW_6_46_9]
MLKESEMLTSWTQSHDIEELQDAAQSLIKRHRKCSGEVYGITYLEALVLKRLGAVVRRERAGHIIDESWIYMIQYRGLLFKAKNEERVPQLEKSQPPKRLARRQAFQ